VDAKPHATGLGGGERGLGAFTDQPGLQLGDSSHLRQNEFAHCAGDLGQISEQHFDAALDQRQQEAGVAREPIELGDDELCLLLLAGLQRSLELRALGSLPAFDLDELADELPRPPPLSISGILNIPAALAGNLLSNQH
jgi:hypothetical protein